MIRRAIRRKRRNRALSNASSYSTRSGEHLRKIQTAQSMGVHIPIAPSAAHSHHSVESAVSMEDEIAELAKTALRINTELYNSLKVTPGEHFFILWFSLATYFPLIAACVGPLANLNNIVSITGAWRENSTTFNPIADRPHVIALNAISLFFGVVGNVALLLNFSGRMRYKRAQPLSIGCFIIAIAFLLSLLVLYKVRYFEDGSITQSAPYFYGCLACFLYLVCLIVLAVNQIGFFKGKYPARYNLDKSQRGLIFFTFLFAIWIGAFSAVFARILSVPYNVAVYFCVVTVLTVGLGDVSPHADLSKAFTLVFALFGMLILGLIIATIRNLVLVTTGPAFFWDRLERKRRKLLKKLIKGNYSLSDEEGFNLMRALRKECKLKQKRISLFFTLFIFLLFLLLGALWFHYAEHWDYFDSFYFCFLCLLTIGYGDLSPKSNFGRPFFCAWALGAVPLMTILVSSAGDSLFSLANEILTFTSDTTVDLIDFISRKADKISAMIRGAKSAVPEFRSGENLSSEMVSDVPPAEGADDREDKAESDTGSIETDDLANIRSVKQLLKEIRHQDKAWKQQQSGPNSGGVKIIYGNAPALLEPLVEPQSPFEEHAGNDVGYSEEHLRVWPNYHRTHSNSISRTTSKVHEKLKAELHARGITPKIVVENLEILNVIKRLLVDTIKYPDKRYSYADWSEVRRHATFAMFGEDPTGDYSRFWLSEMSPLRYPLRESNFLMTSLFFTLEERMKKLLEELAQELHPIRSHRMANTGKSENSMSSHKRRAGARSNTSMFDREAARIQHMYGSMMYAEGVDSLPNADAVISGENSSVRENSSTSETHLRPS